MFQFDSIKLKVSGGLVEFLKMSAIIPYIGIIFVFAITFKIYLTGDDQALLYGLQNALTCLSESPLRHPCEGIQHFPLFQYLIGMPFKLLGFGDASIKELFGWISVASTLIAGAVFWRIGVLSSGKSGGHLALLLLLSGYLVWYMTATFNEATSFSLFALLILSIIDRWRIIPVCCIALACTITKEIAFPFVLYFMFFSFYARELRTGASATILRRVFKFLVEYKFVICAVFFGITINLAFNYFRFGNISNLHNMDPLLYTPWDYVPRVWLSLFTSPAAGLLFTWLSLCLLLVIPPVFLMRDREERILVCCTIIALIIANIGLARWYSSFGWVAWGPRLTLPFLGAVGALGVYLVAPAIISYVRNSNKTSKSIIVFLIVFASSVPNLAVRLDTGLFYSKIFAPTEVAINSGIKSFTVQTARAPLYQEAMLEVVSRNVIIPVSIETTAGHWPIILIWVMTLFLICRKFVAPEPVIKERLNSSHISSSRYFVSLRIQLNRKIFTVRATKTAIIISVIVLMIVSSVIFTRSHRDVCPPCFDFWHKIGFGEVTSRYRLIKKPADLITKLDSFPITSLLGEVQIEFNNPVVLDSIWVSAVDQEGNDVGNWTTRPIEHLWGLGILVEQKLINTGSRSESLKLPVGKKISLWIPDNGNLSNKPKLVIQIDFNEGKHARTLALPIGHNE